MYVIISYLLVELLTLYHHCVQREERV